MLANTMVVIKIYVQALLYTKDHNSPMCGGSIVSHNLILTAAHCTAKYPASEILVAVGVYDWTKPGGQIFKPKGKWEHKNYNPHTYGLYHLSYFFSHCHSPQTMTLPSCCSPTTSPSAEWCRGCVCHLLAPQTSMQGWR